MSHRASGRRAGRHTPRRVHPLVIALTVLAVTAAVIAYAYHVRLPLGGGFRVRMIVSTSQNLRNGSPVRIAGVDAGTVTATRSATGGRAVVTLKLNGAGPPLHADATARVRPRLFLEGTSYVDLEAGSPSAPLMRSGATIPLARTSVAVQTFQVLSMLDQPVRGSLTRTLHVAAQGLSGSASKGLRDALQNLAPVSENAAWIAQSARGTGIHDLSDFIQTASSVTSSLAGSRAQLADLVTELNRTAGALADTGGALGRSISGIDGLLRAAPPELAAFDRALPPVTTLSRALRPALKLAPTAVPPITEAVDELGSLVAPTERPKLISALRAALVQLPTLVDQLGTVLPTLTPITDCLRTHFVPILNAKVPDGNLSTGQPVWEEFAHMTTGLAGSAQNFDANGYMLRILADAGHTVVGSVSELGKAIVALPGQGGMLGARPQWIGDLTPDAFHPEAPCASQPLPSLTSAAAAPDIRSATPAAPAAPVSSTQIMSLLGRLRTALSRPAADRAAGTRSR